MIRYATGRIFNALLIVWGVLTITFVMIHLAPGDPASLYVRPDIDPQTVEQIRRQMGLHLPLWSQYWRWLGGFVQGNFGVSFLLNRPVAAALAEAIPNTLLLTVTVFLLQLMLGSALGILGAAARGSRLDRYLGNGLLLLYSLPGFWLALMAILLFSLQLGWLPSSHMASIDTAPDLLSQLVDRLRHLALPALVLTTPFAAYTARFLRGSLIEALGQEYIQTARAYGLSETQVVFKYALKNALLPVVTLLGLYLPFLLGGAVITEYIFAWPGMGRLTINAIFAHDFPVILATAFVAAVSVVIGNLLSDILYAAVDPRISIMN